jgi:SAM-dependent methyltransferase
MKEQQQALYDSFIADYYDNTPILVQRTRDIAFYVDSVKKYGEPVLELGCGTGRVTTAIAEAGYRVVGLDISEKMLERAVAKRKALPTPVRDRLFLLEGDMTKFSVGGKFRTIIIPFRPFQDLVETAQQMACLNCVKDHLEPEGRLIFDVFQMDADRIFDPRYQQESSLIEYDLPDGRHVALSERVAAFHRAEQKNDVEMVFNVHHNDGKDERLVLAWTLRYFFRYEIEHLLARCGFRVEVEYGNFDRSPLGDDSPEMIFVAQVAR